MTYIEFDNNLQANISFALEEYIMTNSAFKDEYFIFWRNVPTLMVGRFQNTIQEINTHFVADNDITVVRRNSGGGTIYTDLGTWQFSFITWKEKDKVKDFRSFTRPIIEALSKLGINTEFSGRNDLMLKDKKYSGNAQFSIGDRFLHHGSILFDSNFEFLIRSLNISDAKIMSKGIKSIRERVVNIKSSLINPNISADEFKRQMIDIIGNKMEHINIGAEHYEAIENIQKEKFNTWEWNYGKSPEFNITKTKQFSGGKVEVNLFVKNGIIIDCKFTGDFFFIGNIDAFQNIFINCKYDKYSIESVLRDSGMSHLFHLITLQDLIELFD